MARVECTCPQCGRTFHRWPSQFKHKHQAFCSPACKVAAQSGVGAQPWKDRLVRGVCQQCGASISVKPSRVLGGRGKFCSHECHSTWLRGRAGIENPQWKGVPYRTEAGYMRVNTPDGRRRYVHQLVWEAAHGPIPPRHHVHHRNGVKDDNTLGNLQLLTESEHHRLHGSRSTITTAPASRASP